MPNANLVILSEISDYFKSKYIYERPFTNGFHYKGVGCTVHPPYIHCLLFQPDGTPFTYEIYYTNPASFVSKLMAMHARTTVVFSNNLKEKQHVDYRAIEFIRRGRPGQRTPKGFK